eukprot:g32508.t1
MRGGDCARPGGHHTTPGGRCTRPDVTTPLQEVAVPGREVTTPLQEAAAPGRMSPHHSRRPLHQAGDHYTTPGGRCTRLETTTPLQEAAVPGREVTTLGGCCARPGIHHAGMPLRQVTRSPHREAAAAGHCTRPGVFARGWELSLEIGNCFLLEDGNHHQRLGDIPRWLEIIACRRLGIVTCWRTGIIRG